MSPHLDTAVSTAPDDAERRQWFGQFGYAGDLTEIVTLRDVEGQPPGLTASVADVWATLCGLTNLQQVFTNQFHRVGNWAVRNLRPQDPANRLCTAEFGPLIDTGAGNWLPGRREIVLALLDTDPADEDGLIFLLHDEPLVQNGAHEEVARAA